MSPLAKLLASAVFLLLTGSAVEQFTALQATLRDARARQDWPASLRAATELKALLHDSPDVLLEVAREDVRVGDTAAAFRELTQYVRLGQSADLPNVASEFATLGDRPEFADLDRGMRANRTPIAHGSTAFVLPDTALLPEDVDYDPEAKRFYFTSVREAKIVSADARGTRSDFARSPDGWPLLAIKIDHARGLLWATEVAVRGFAIVPESAWGRSAVLCYDLRTGALRQRIEGPRPSALGDMVLTPEGDVIVSDGDAGGVYRLAANGTRLTRVDNGDFISPQTPALHPDAHHLFVPDYARGIAVLDLTTKAARWLTVDGPFALTGIDGMYFDHGRLIAVQNGTSPERVVMFTLDPSLTRVVSETVIERSTETLGDPTHGVIIGRDFYYIANSGWSDIDEHGALKPHAHATPARLMAAPLTPS